MTTELKLKLRDRGDSVTVPTQLIVSWFDQADEDTSKARMYRFFESLKDGDVKIHDKVFMLTTLNWAPVKMTERGPVSQGMPANEQLRWHRIFAELEEINDKEEGVLKLRSKDIKLIWDRWTNPEFKMESMYRTPWIFACMLDFMKVTNRWPDDIEDDLKEDLGLTEKESETEEVKGSENERESSLMPEPDAIAVDVDERT